MGRKKSEHGAKLQNPLAPDPSPVMQLRKATENQSCGLLAISAYTGVLYEDIVRTAALVCPPHGGRSGLTLPEIRRILAALDFPMRKKKPAVDELADVHGIVLFRQHCAVIRNGLLFEPDLTVWEIADWMAANPEEDYEGILVPYVRRPRSSHT